MDGAACVQLCSDPPIFKYKLTALTFRICLVKSVLWRVAKRLSLYRRRTVPKGKITRLSKHAVVTQHYGSANQIVQFYNPYVTKLRLQGLNTSHCFSRHSTLSKWSRGKEFFRSLEDNPLTTASGRAGVGQQAESQLSSLFNSL